MSLCIHDKCILHVYFNGHAHPFSHYGHQDDMSKVFLENSRYAIDFRHHDAYVRTV